jgi:hypothetical protein
MQWNALNLASQSSAMRLTRADKRLFIGGLLRLSLKIGGNRSMFPHGAGVCMSTRTHLCWDPFQQLLNEAEIYSSLW